MKYAIMSDAHANPDALKKAFSDAISRGCGKFVFLGDATGYGYDAKSTVDFIRDHFDVVLMGNHDSACLGLEDYTEVCLNPHYDTDRENRKVLTKADKKWLRSCKYRYDCKDFSCVHGDFIGPKDWGYIMEARDAWYNFQAVDAQVTFCGHTHHACVWEKDAEGDLSVRFDDSEERLPKRPESLSIAAKKSCRYIVNCGSVGYPRHDHCSTYAIYNADTRRIAIRRLLFDFPGYIAAMTRRGVALPNWLVGLGKEKLGKV